ncbi:YbaK/EbsC family protein [Candidatus Babeliales bacterium]|nr:YbaK/EbsC family protein [Candidatus Babeliales bacterium]
MKTKLEQLVAAHKSLEIIVCDIPTKTSESAAEFLGVPLSSIVKTLVVKADTQKFFAFVLCGHDRLDRHEVVKILNCKKFRFATPEETLVVTSYPPGGIPPIGLNNGLEVFVDDKVMQHDVVYAGGGQVDKLLKIQPELLVALSSCHIGQFSLEIQE